MGNILPAAIVSALSVALYGMFLAVVIPAARNDRAVAIVVTVSFLFSYAATQLPLLSTLSSGTRTILLTLVISSAAAVLFPVKTVEAAEKKPEASSEEVKRIA